MRVARSARLRRVDLVGAGDAEARHPRLPTPPPPTAPGGPPIKTGGERGIRTLGTFRYTRFPIVLLRPLGHLSRTSGTFGDPCSLFNFQIASGADGLCPADPIAGGRRNPLRVPVLSRRGWESNPRWT